MLADYQSKHEEAKFFMIKSFNEDDIHKSIKYNVWASTPLGNEKLDAAFWDAQGLVEKGSKCPIFLFFSVNSSGQFVGLAEMLGPVDFNKNMDFWQQEKWNGFLPLKWHIVKDIPNRMFQSITLENNGNYPVVFSKDTQEKEILECPPESQNTTNIVDAAISIVFNKEARGRVLEIGFGVIPSKVKASVQQNETIQQLQTIVQNIQQQIQEMRQQNKLEMEEMSWGHQDDQTLIVKEHKD